MVENVNVLQVFQNKVTLSETKRFVSNKDIDILAERYGTPLYVINEKTLHDKVLELHHAYKNFNGDVKIAYSIKANFNPSVLKTFMKDGITFDLTSLGELYFMNRLKCDPENIVYTSVTEELDEYVEVLKNGVKRIVVSSYYGFVNLSKAARMVNIRPKIMVRINPEVSVKAEVRASYKNGKFGVPFNGGKTDSAYFIVKAIFNDPLLTFEGFHFHLGSQITNFICYVNALERLNSLINKLKKEVNNFSIAFLDIGGGTPVFYNDPVPTPDEMASIYVEKLNNLVSDHGNFTLMIESGRFLVAESSIMVSKIVNIKEYNDHRIIILDTGYHLLLDAALLKQEYPQEVIPCENYVYEVNIHATKKHPPVKNVSLAGRLCDTLDVFPISKISDLSYAYVGNYVLFYNVGAYSLVFNMPFHCQTKPPVLMKTINNDFKLIRKGTSFEELFIEEGGQIS
jgi:diaminopimelate decarboxylase